MFARYLEMLKDPKKPTAKLKRKRGLARPSLNDPAIVEALCNRLAGGESIADACRLKSMPSEVEVYRHMARDEIFESRIARAREAQQDFEADNCVKMADNATAEDWQVVRLRIWARQWRASKLAPRKYGTERPPPMQSNTQVNNTVNIAIPPDQYRALIQDLLDSV